MGNRSFYGDDQVQNRRCSSRGHPYSLNQSERELPSPPAGSGYARSRGQISACREAENAEQIQDHEGILNPRRRIPVACVRCRKRKIRCSGDQGNNQPCTNCKTAGYDPCNFLRVSSHEAQLKLESPEFGYETVPRLPSRGLSIGTPSFNHPNPLSPDSQPYRANSLSTYQFPAKGYYGMPNYTDYADENINVDYLEGTSALQGYPLLSSDHNGMIPSYNASGNARNWPVVPQFAKQTLFMDQDSTYGQGQVSYASSSSIARTQTSLEPKFTHAMNSYSASTVLNDRVLPLPGANRSTASFLRYADNGPPATSLGYLPSQSSVNQNYMNTNNNATVSETASISASYPPSLSNSSPESTSSRTIYESHRHPRQQQVYAAVNTDGYAGLREGSPSPGSYSHGQSSDCGSHSSQGQAEPSHSNGNLSSGQDYIPYLSRNYTIPSMEPGVASVSPRRYSSIQTSAS